MKVNGANNATSGTAKRLDYLLSLSACLVTNEASALRTMYSFGTDSSFSSISYSSSIFSLTILSRTYNMMPYCEVVSSLVHALLMQRRRAAWSAALGACCSARRFPCRLPCRCGLPCRSAIDAAFARRLPCSSRHSALALALALARSRLLSPSPSLSLALSIPLALARSWLGVCWPRSRSLAPARSGSLSLALSSLALALSLAVALALALAAATTTTTDAALCLSAQENPSCFVAPIAVMYSSVRILRGIGF